MANAPRTSARDRYAALFSESRPSERLQFFSDAVFAIAMTLLVLDIHLPDIDRTQLADALRDLQPEFFAYALSFVVIAASWMSHHRRFEIIERVDTRLIQLNLALLFVIAFLPFPTSVLSEYGTTTPAVVLYGSTVAALGIVQLLTWSYVNSHGLFTHPIDQGAYRFARRGMLVNPVVFGVSIVIALLGWPTVALYSWLALLPVSFIVERLRLD